jgi:hypothetical protein
MTTQTFEIIDGVYVGPEVYEGDLDLQGYKDTLISLGCLIEVGDWLGLGGCTSLTSLGSLTEVRGSLYLKGCTSLTSLGSLNEVRGGLYLFGCTSLVSLGSLEEVGDILDLEGGVLSLQELCEKVLYYSSLPLHEALNALHTDEVCKVPLYKNILLQTLQGG